MNALAQPRRYCVGWSPLLGRDSWLPQTFSRTYPLQKYPFVSTGAANRLPSPYAPPFSYGRKTRLPLVGFLVSLSPAPSACEFASVTTPFLRPESIRRLPRELCRKAKVDLCHGVVARHQPEVAVRRVPCERGGETERCRTAQATAPLLDSTGSVYLHQRLAGRYAQESLFFVTEMTLAIGSGTVKPCISKAGGPTKAT
jgi:hypothetical protein